MQGNSPAKFYGKFVDINYVFISSDAWCTADLSIFFIFFGFLIVLVVSRFVLVVSRFVLSKFIHTFDTCSDWTDEDWVGRDPIDEIIDVSHNHKWIEQQSNIIVREFLDCKKYHAYLYYGIDIAVECEVACKCFMLTYCCFHGIEQQFAHMPTEMILQVVNFYLLYAFNSRRKTILNGTAFTL